ncbi:MAG: GNAT family N-acetyltransferase [Chloroflexota bacterium]|nr:GNAT family N-acetyltransferase [Chloroflexota bacterium]
MNRVVVKLAESQGELQRALQVRHRVFVGEQQIPVEIERDEYDATALHAIALVQGKVVGTGRVVRQDDGFARIGRMAVDQAFRERGIGGRILAQLEDESRDRGSEWAMLHAQQYIEEFYVKRGYSRHGGVFMEADIPHVEMRKRL